MGTVIGCAGRSPGVGDSDAAIGLGGGGSGAGGATFGFAGSATSAGSATGGTHAGGVGGTSGNGCRGWADCAAKNSTGSVSAICYAPYSTAVASGAPTCLYINRQWCGQCSCPTMPASCTQNSECTVEHPFCEAVLGGGLSACSECVADTDCPAAHPHCINDVGIPRTCRQCTSTSECTEGACSSSDHTCHPQCQTDADCQDPALTCTSAKRCEFRACPATASCPDFSTCTSASTCQRKTCTSDSDCAGGYCVNGACYGSLGSCSFTYSPY